MRYLLLFAGLLLLTGCTTAIEDVKDPDMIGEKVTVSGTVKNSIKIGSLSGYTLEDETGRIGVRSDTLPEEGEKKTVTGVLLQDTIFGYYIKAD